MKNKTDKMNSPLFRILTLGLLVCVSFFFHPEAAFSGERPKVGEGIQKVQVTPSALIRTGFRSAPAKPALATYRLLTLQGDLVMTLSAPAGQSSTIHLASELGNLPKGPYLLIEHDGSRRESSSVIIVGP